MSKGKKTNNTMSEVKNDFLDNLESALPVTEDKKWKGTFRDFLRLYETNKFPNAGDTAHQRIERMILNAGTERVDYFGQTRTKYNFFESALFGIESTVDALMNFIHAAARRTETSRRMLLLYGPVSSGKSDICTLIKRGLERFSCTQEGAVFALSGSKMNENPFLLVPEHLRDEFTKHYGVHIEGNLSPHTQWRVDNEFHGKFMDFPVERIFLSESRRIGVGTWEPTDPKSNDQSELTGSIDFARIQEFGDEADPRAFNFNGELNVSNRGIMEFIEGLKSEEKFLRVLLTATQEKVIKAPRFGLISVDTLIIIHSNEEEVRNFMAEPRFKAYHDRMVPIKVPYNLCVSNEVGIYEKLLGKSDLDKCKIAPHTLKTCAIVSALSRMEPPTGDLSLIKKMRLYDGQHVRGMKTEQVLDMRRKSLREGMTGISPRFVIDQINMAIAKTIEDNKTYITPIDALRQITFSTSARDSFTEEEKIRYKELLDIARQEFNDLLRNDIQKAFFLSFEDEAKSFCTKYLEQIEAALNGTNPRDPVTGDETELDENLMDAIESHIGVSSSGKDDFRNEILRYFGSAALKGKKVDYSQHAALREAIQKQLFAERQNVIRMTVSTTNPDPEALRRLNEVVDRMVTQHGYTAESANELLKYASAHLFEKK